MIVYLETSALLCWILEEESIFAVKKIVNETRHFVSSSLLEIEVGRAIQRLKVAKKLSSSFEKRISYIWDKIFVNIEIMEITRNIINRSQLAFPIEPVRSLDAIHLATALEFNKIYLELKILSFDERILGNLKPLGLSKAL